MRLSCPTYSEKYLQRHKYDSNDGPLGKREAKDSNLLFLFKREDHESEDEEVDGGRQRCEAEQQEHEGADDVVWPELQPEQTD